MKKFTEVLQDQNGNKLAGVSVQVNISGGGAATLYSDQGVTPLANPVTTSSLGYINFYVADGRYDLVISGTGVTTLTISDIEIADITGNVSGSDSVTEVNALSIGGGANITTSNATGTGSLVKQTSPTLITPVLGVAAGTSLALGGGTALATTNQTGTGSLVLASSPTITSPVLNGTPTGTGIPTMTLKKGSGAGNYSSASTTYVRIDSTNLAYTVTIPVGWKLAMWAAVPANTATSATVFSLALADGSADNTGIFVETASPAASSTTSIISIPLTYVIIGDGASHTINLQYKTSNAADSVQISNSSGTNLPTMTFLLSPSN